MTEYIDSFCILIASHISNSKRIEYLLKCIESLIKQNTLIYIQIYLSISFENQVLKDEFKEIIKREYLIYNPYINIFIREEKTAQMRHYYILLDEIKLKHKWVMFCDDDDTYNSNRIINIIKTIHYIETQNKTNSILAGIYESHCEKDHREHRHEYWCYCVNKVILERFYDRIKDYPDIIDNKCCDILFGEYMRRLNKDFVFARLNMKLYNYRVEENQDSITGVIQSKQGFYTRNNEHPPIGDPRLPEYILDWNDYLYKHLDAYLHDVFLRTIVGCNMEYILQSEFRKDYELLSFIDECHVNKMREKHEYWRMVCSKLYDVPLL